MTRATHEPVVKLLALKHCIAEMKEVIEAVGNGLEQRTGVLELLALGYTFC